MATHRLALNTQANRSEDREAAVEAIRPVTKPAETQPVRILAGIKLAIRPANSGYYIGSSSYRGELRP